MFRLNTIGAVGLALGLTAGTVLPVQAGTLVLPGAAFDLGGDPHVGAEFHIFGGYWRIPFFAGQANLHAAVTLPDGATVTSFTVYYYDDDSAAELECNLRRSLRTGTGGNGVLAATVSSDDDSIDHSMTDATISTPVVDNSLYQYFVESVSPSGSDGERRLYSVEINYNDPPTAVDGQSFPKWERASVEPNPFESSTSIRFSLSKSSRVTVDIFDVRGRRIRTIDKPLLGAGTHTLQWDGQDDRGRRTASGVYFVQVRGENEALAAKLVRMK